MGITKIQKGGRVHDEGEPRAQNKKITKDEVEQEEWAIEEHPPRDYAKEREITVYSAPAVSLIRISLPDRQIPQHGRFLWLRAWRSLHRTGRMCAASGGFGARRS